MECTQEMMTSDDFKAKKARMTQATGDEDYESSEWWSIPDLALLKILTLLDTKDILSVSATCRRWNEVANDDILWKHHFQQHFRTEPSITLKPGRMTKCVFQ